MTTYKDTIPANANIDIDYTVSDKGTVKFSYPLPMSYWTAVWRRGSLGFYNFFAGIFVYPFIIFSIVFFKYMPYQRYIILNGIMVFLLAVMPMIANLMLATQKEHYSNLIPRLNYYNARYLFSKVKERVFTAEDIQHDSEGYHFTIPHFSNVYLKYKATGTIARKLQTIKIKSHTFKYYKISWFGKKTKEKTDYDFSARFGIEDNVQLDGEIEVRYA